MASASTQVTATTSQIFAHFSGKVSDINYATNEVDTFTNGVEVPIKMRTTALAVKEYISKHSGIPLNHISLSVNCNYTIQDKIGPKTYPEGYVYSHGVNPSANLKDNDSIIGALKTPIAESLSKYKLKTYSNPVLSFSPIKCDDTSHCPDVVKIKQLDKETFSRLYSEDMTIAELRKAIAEKGINTDKFILFCRNKQLNDDATTLKDAGIGADSRIGLIPNITNSRVRVHHDSTENQN